VTTNTETPSVTDLHRVVEELSRRIERLELELAAARAHPRPLPIDTVLAISGAVAAYLGKRATVRQIHFARGPAWAQQGRAAVQASHRVPHGPPAPHGPHVVR
jgi:methylmalonyl-CoA carboxyltransferase 12S subunit